MVLFIVRRGAQETFDLLRRISDRGADVQVFWDRRVAERRRRREAVSPERRRQERRASSLRPSLDFVTVHADPGYRAFAANARDPELLHDDVLLELVTETQGSPPTTMPELWMVFHGTDRLGPMSFARALDAARAIAVRERVDVFRVQFPARPERIESYRV